MGAAASLEDHISAGYYKKKHKEFHVAESCATVPRVGNWTLAHYAALLVGYVVGEATSETTYGSAMETWLYRISIEPEFEDMFMKLIQEINLLHDIPTRFHDTLEWNTTEKGVEKQLRFFYPEPVEPKSAEAFVQPTRGHRRERPHKETSARQAPQKRADIVEIDSEEESYYTESSYEEVEVEGEEDDAGEEPVESPPKLREDADAEMEDATAEDGKGWGAGFGP